MLLGEKVWSFAGTLPIPKVRLSWVHDLLFCGIVYRREVEPGPGGRGRFRCTSAGGMTTWTVEWADSRWVRMRGQTQFFYNALDSPDPPATGWKDADDGNDVDEAVCPVLRSWLEPKKWDAYEENERMAAAMRDMTRVLERAGISHSIVFL